MARGRDDGGATDPVEAAVTETGERLVRFAAVVGAGAGGADDAVARAADALAEEVRHVRPGREHGGGRDGRLVHTVHTAHPAEVVADAARGRLLRAAQARAAAGSADGDPDAGPADDVPAGDVPGAALGDLDPVARALLVLRTEDGYDAFRAAAALGLDPADARDRLAALDADLRARRTTPAAVLAAVGPVPADGLADAVAQRLAAAARRSRRARRRAGLAVGAVAAVAVVGLGAAAILGGAGAGAGDAAGHPSPSSRYIGYADVTGTAPIVCGQTVEDDPDLTAAMTLTSEDSTIVDGQAWTGHLDLDADAMTPEQYALTDAGALRAVPVLTNGTVVVGVADPDGTSFDSTLALGATSGAATGDASGDDDVDGAGRGVAADFISCGVDLAAGSYEVQVVASTADHRHWIVSNSVPLRVLQATPTGSQPRWLQGSALACGESIDELEARVQRDQPSTIGVDDVVVGDDRITYRFRNLAGPKVTVVPPRRMAVAWVRNGTVVSVGAADTGTATRSLDVGDTLRVSTGRLGTTNYCGAQDADGRYTGHVPAGTYQLVAYGRFAVTTRITTKTASDGSTTQRLVVADDHGWVVAPLSLTDVTITADGRVEIG